MSPWPPEETMDIKSFPFSIGLIFVVGLFMKLCITCLNVTKVSLGDKRNMDWEEVVRFAIYTELQAATLVFVIDDRK